MNRKYKLKNKHKKIIIIAIIVLGIIALTTFIACIVLTPKLYLTSNKDMTIEINKGYTEPGYKSYVLNKDITNNVEVSNNINPKKIGSYQVNYKIKYLIFDVKKTRTVKVIDSKPPTLKLIGSNHFHNQYNRKPSTCPSTLPEHLLQKQLPHLYDRSASVNSHSWQSGKSRLTVNFLRETDRYAGTPG